MRKINIVCAKSWGKLGNYNSARNVARFLENQIPNCETHVLAMEELWPEFANWGQGMQDAATSENPDDVNEAFESINAGIAVQLQDAHALEQVLVMLDQNVFSDSDICIGMKGIITHLMCQARVRFGRAQRVFNWITNPGLLEVSIHRCPEADLHLTPLIENIDTIASWGVPRNKVHPIGPPISLAKDFSATFDGQIQENDRRCALVFYFHHLNGPCLDVVSQTLEQNRDTHAYVLYASQDKEMMQDILQCEAQWGTRIRINSAREQSEFMTLLDSLSRFSSRALIAKSGPNTMFEAISLGMPMILFRSGLPQEEWVGRYIVENKVGLCVDRLADVPRALGTMRANEHQHSIIQNQSAIRQRLGLLATRRLAVLEEAISDFEKVDA